MFKRILSTVADALARRKPAAPDPIAQRSARRAAQVESARSADSRDKAADAAARASSLADITDTTKLLTLSDAPTTRSQALIRLAELGAAGNLGDVLTRRPELRNALLLASQDSAYAERELNAIGVPAELLLIATTAQMPRVRQLAAAKINDEAGLVALERKTRGRDKTVHRQAKQRLDELRSANAALTAHTTELEQLRERTALLARSEHDPLFNARLDHLQRSFATWQARAVELRTSGNAAVPETWDTADVAAALTAAVERAAHNAAEAAATASAIELTMPTAMPTAMPNSMATSMAASMAASMAMGTDPGTDPIQAATSAPSDSAAAALPAGIATAETIAEHEGALADVSDVHADVCRDPTQVLDRLALVPPALQLVQRRWSAASDRAPAPAQVAEHFRRQTQELKDGVDAAMRFEQRTADVDQLINAPAPAETTPKEAEDYRRLSAQQQEHHNWSRRARDLLRNLRWPAAIPGPTSITQLHAGLAARETFDAHCNAQWQALQAQVETALSELSTAIDAGVYRAANASLGEARRLLRGLPARHSGKLQSQCTTLAARVQEMRDWQDFATHPKREALCASMELLVEEQLDPESRADRIKALRAEWHDLGPLTSASERALFDRFNAAATSAFAPARAYFEEQAKLRAENLVNRQRVCSTLAHYVANNDWSKADWKLAQQVLRLAREEFLSYSPVDRGPGRDVGKRFDTAADALHALIKGEWDKNVATKERIVADAAQLLSATDPLSTRIERVKSLQHEWRNIGATPRGADQKLWKLFRAHCDAVFTAREAERQVHEVAAHSEAETATGVCEALEARGADPTPIENQSELAALRARFDALQLFGDAARRLQRRFKDGEQAYLQRLRDHQHAERRQDFLSILDVNDVLAGFERNPATFDEAALAAALEMAGDTNLDARVATLRANNVAPLAADADVAAERLRWTIYAEILAGLDSPGEDQSLRLELQVNRLAEGLGRRGTERLDLPAVLAAWVSAGADTGDARTVTWRARLEKAIDAYLG